MGHIKMHSSLMKECIFLFLIPRCEKVTVPLRDFHEAAPFQLGAHMQAEPKKLARPSSIAERSRKKQLGSDEVRRESDRISATTEVKLPTVNGMLFRISCDKI